MRALLCTLVLLFVATGACAEEQEVVKGVFEVMQTPRLKRFFFDSVLKDEYARLSVNFIPGATPVLILYGANDEELSREVVRRDISFDELHTLVQSKGFVRVPKHDSPEEEDPYDDGSDEGDSGAYEPHEEDPYEGGEEEEGHQEL